MTAAERVRAFGYVVIAAIYFYFVEGITVRAANGLAGGFWTPLVQRSILLFLLVVGYSAMGRLFNKQPQPGRAMGLNFRQGWRASLG